MAKSLISLLSMFLSGIATAGAVVVEATPGNLASVVADYQQVSALTIKGSINAVDLDFIDTSMPALRTLDLSEVSIVAYSGNRLRGVSEHKAGRIPSSIFVSSRIEKLILPASGSISIGDAAFAGSALRSIELPANIAEMGIGAFSNCAELTEVSISTSNIGEATFAGCPILASVSINVPLAVPAYAFNACPSLAAVIGSDKVESIGSRAFALCGVLSEFSFGRNLTDIGAEAFIEAGLTDVDLADCRELESVEDWAFARMPNLKSVNLGSARTLGAGIVFECPELVDMHFSDRAAVVPDYAYTKNVSMDTTVMFNPDVTHIGRHALSGLTQVSTITLPPALEYVGDAAMENMTGLSTINLGVSQVPATGENVWAGVDQTNVDLYVPEEAVDNYRATPQWQEFRITGVSGITDVESPVADAVIRACFDGNMIIVEYTGIDLTAVTVYDVDGTQMLPSVSADASGRMIIDATSLPARSVYLIVARINGAGPASIKIAKN
ncbi:MAG: leucine-rich repeat domain-containing protein [Odoribacter sp.]|nr:leucine-rich repeat domain-containing protein [Odoribacter sp.]